MWPFYVLNFATRKKKKTAEDISLMDFFKEGLKTLKICQNSRGDTSWIDRIYYSKPLSLCRLLRHTRKLNYIHGYNINVDGHGPQHFFHDFSLC
jgi:hypothetical protein